MQCENPEPLFRNDYIKNVYCDLRKNITTFEKEIIEFNENTKKTVEPLVNLQAILEVLFEKSKFESEEILNIKREVNLMNETIMYLRKNIENANDNSVLAQEFNILSEIDDQLKKNFSNLATDVFKIQTKVHNISSTAFEILNKFPSAMEDKLNTFKDEMEIRNLIYFSIITAINFILIMVVCVVLYIRYIKKTTVGSYTELVTRTDLIH